jgi:flagellar hook-associated protein 3 FlgL
MRITHSMIAATNLRNLATNQARLEQYSNQLTSGRRLTKPSDDPVAAASALGYRTRLDELAQHLKNIDEAAAWLSTTDTALDSVGETLHRAIELATAGATDSLSADDRLAIKQEIDALVQHTLHLANTTYAGRSVFAGTRTTTPAYTTGTPPTFAGDTSQIQREIGPGATIVINVVGQATFDAVFTAMNNLSNALGANDAVATGATITALQQAETQLLSDRAQTGARTNRLDAQRARLLDLQVGLSDLRSKAEDTDYTQTLSNFATAETVYKAALQASARSLQPSLLDYLR